MRHLLRERAEFLVLHLVARDRAEEMAIQRRDEAGERRAAGVVEAHFARVLGWGLRDVEADGLSLVQLQHDGEKPVATQGTVPGAGSLS